jgi:TrmH family RNA methyltransferase
MAISKNSIKFIKSLGIKKFRQKYNKFTVEGDKMLREILMQKDLHIESLYATDSWIQTHKPENKIQQDRIFKITLTELDRISSLKTPNQVLAVIETPEYLVDSSLLENDLSLYLDDIQDPGNLGTILRIADWFGIPQVICSPGTVEVFNSKVIQSSMGAFLRIKTPVISLNDILKQNDNLPVYGAVLDGENIFTIEKIKNGIIVIGNEGKGISEQNSELLTKKISIPATSSSGAESLNAAVATGIICAIVRN